MAYAEILRLTLAHAYFGSDVPPLTARPVEPQGFDRAQLLLRQRGAMVHVLADEEAERPAAVQLMVRGQNMQVLEVTKGVVWGGPVDLAAPLGVAEVDLAAGDAPMASEPPRRLGQDIATLDIALPQAGRRDLTLTLEAVAAHWAYHLTGQGDLADLQVIDSDGAVQFEDLGLMDLPGGQAARVIRSAQALATRARSDQRFTLQKSGPFGPETLVPVLPSAAPPFKPIPDVGADMRLQSDIFVTLW